MSFIEQGRSRPGPGIVARLADALELSPRERNDLLLAAGFAPAFPESPLDDEALRPVRRALDTILDGHLPYPAMVVRPHGVLVATGAQPRPIARRAAHRARGLSPPMPSEPAVLGFAVPLELESSDGHLRLMTTLTSLATATDVTLAELHLEAFLPADEVTADVLRRRAEHW